MKNIVVFFVLLSLHTQGLAMNSMLTCNDREGLYKIQIKVDFSKPTTIVNNERHCAQLGKCNKDAYGEEYCDCLSYEYYEVSSITWPIKIKVGSKSTILNKNGYAIASGGKNGNIPTEYSTLNIFELILDSSLDKPLWLRVHGGLNLLSRKFTSFPYRDDEIMFITPSWIDIDGGSRYYLDCKGIH